MKAHTNAWKSQIKGKESENSYQELKKSQKDRHTQTVSKYLDTVSVRLWVPVLL